MADVFLSEPGWRIRGITRDPTKSAAQSLSAKGIEMVQADLDEPSTLQNAFQGANAIYAVTDFWQPFFNPSTKAKLKPGQIMNEFCHAAKMSVVQIGLYATHWQAAPLLAPQKVNALHRRKACGY